MAKRQVIRAQKFTQAGLDALARFAEDGEPLVGTLQIRPKVHPKTKRLWLELALVTTDGEQYTPLIILEPIDPLRMSTITFTDSARWAMRWMYVPVEAKEDESE